jgi:membrane protease YdiL (CAAX protease family)
MMIPREDHPIGNPEPDPHGEHSAHHDPGDTLGGDPITYAARCSALAAHAVSGPPRPTPPLAEALRAPWSWGHFLVFLFFTGASFLVVQTALAVYYAPPQRLTEEQYKHYLLSKPQFVFGSTVICSALIFLFLYVTLSVLRNLPFWSTLGWRRLKPNTAGRQPSPWIYFFCGFALAIFVALAGSQVHTKEAVPIQELFKTRDTALIFMAMAVLVAPLVEETVFRGYLFPLFAKSFGIAPGIVLTGILFGLMHGYQLGWTWGIVVLLIVVGVIFTFARAYAGTVLASFLMHLGYNSMIAASAIISTHGFTRIPPGP